MIRSRMHARLLHFLALQVFSLLHRALPGATSSDRVVIVALLMHLAAPSPIMASVSPHGLMQTLSAARPLDVRLRRAVLARSQPRASSPRVSRVFGRILKILHSKHVVTTSGTGVDHGPPMVVPQMVKRIWMPKQTVASVKAITMWGASGKVITQARALSFFPVTLSSGSRMLLVRSTSCGFDLIM